MPFDTPATYTAIDDGLYIAQLVRLEDTSGDWGDGNKWVFHLWDKASKAPVVNDDGSGYEFFQFSSAKMTNRSKARAWFEALIGRAIVDGENPADIVVGALTKYVEVLIGTEMKDGKQRTSIMKMSPVTVKGQGGKQQATAPAPQAAPQPEPERELEAVGAATGGPGGEAFPWEN